MQFSVVKDLFTNTFYPVFGYDPYVLSQALKWKFSFKEKENANSPTSGKFAKSSENLEEEAKQQHFFRNSGAILDFSQI